MFVRPAEGMKIRRPDTYTLLPVEGADVPDVAWCRRRLRDKDVIAGEAPVASASVEHAAAAPAAPAHEAVAPPSAG